MLKAPIPKNEEERLKTLEEYKILDTKQEEFFDEITKSASLISGCKISLISLVDSERQWFKSKRGLEASETPRDISFCGHSIMGDDVFIIEDSAKDERFCDNPLFLDEPHVRFYAGSPLIAPNGHRLGTLCVIDSEAKSLDENQVQLLKSLSKQVMDFLELRKNAEDLRDTQSKRTRVLSDILSSTPACLKVINKDGQLLDMNSQGLSLIEADDLESVYKANVYDLLEESHRANFIEFNERICSGSKESLIFEIIGLRGTRRWMESYAAPFKLEDGETAHIAITNDISERVKSEEEYARQKIVAQHQAKLVSIGELAAGVGHEVNNPLAIIKGYLMMMENDFMKSEGSVPGFVRSYLQKINVATERIEKIVQGLRTFSRSDSSEITDFSALEALEESLNMISEIYERDGYQIDFKNNVIEKDVLITGNRGKFQQILMNLISNARDAVAENEDKKISVTVCANKNVLEVTIKDNGVGIPAEIQQKVFDPFFTTKEVNKGTGIGLSLVHSFVGEMKGSLSIDSETGKGTSFTFDLPASFNKKTQPVGNDVFSKTSEEKFAGNIILVDDEEHIREFLTSVLENLGLNVTKAENGKQALDLYSSDPDKYDLIVTDMKMPVMDGPTMLKAIRSDEDLVQPKIVFITGGININFEDKENELNSLIDGYLFKPFELDKVKEVLNACLKNKKEDAA